MDERVDTAEPEGIVPLAQVERQAIEAALRVCGGHRARTAKALGISVKTLYNKLRAYAEVSA